MEAIGTINSDEEVDIQDETDSEEDIKASKKSTSKDVYLKGGVFAKGFRFEGDDKSKFFEWDMKEAIEMAAKKENNFSSSMSNLDAKIARAKETRRLQKERKKEESTKEDQYLEEDGAHIEDSEADSSFSEESEDETLKEEKKNAFFTQPPPLSTEIAFTDMNLSRPLLRAVTSVGFATPTPIQAKTIPLALMGKDICACAATGTGKTGAFMLPILERLLYRPTHIRISRVLILVPTRELAIQVHSVGKALAQNTNIELCLAAGGLETKGQEAALRKNPDIIIATPGRLVDHLHNTPSFSLQTIEILVLDEADRMLDEHFMDQMNEIIRLCPVSRQTLLFSATMTDEIEELARLSLSHPVRVFVDSNMDTADNLYQEFVRIRPNRESDREAILTALCSRSFKDHCLVFLPTKRLAHKMRIVFGLLDMKATELHGSLTQLQRLESLKKFKDGEADFLLATDLAARGLDIEKVKTVLNFSMPPTLKQYIHRVGRTARARRSGKSVTLVGEKGRKILKEVVKQAKVPPKSRVISPFVIDKYKEKIKSFEEEIITIMKQEEEEKEMRVAEMEMNKAKNMMVHEKEIYSRPPRVWFQKNSERGKKRRGDGDGGNYEETKRKKVDKAPKEMEAYRAMQFAKREAKRAKKAVRQSELESQSTRKKKSVASRQPVISSHDRGSLKSYSSNNPSRGMTKVNFKPKRSNFKSKKRYKRR